jgi:hypothetical protein
MRRTAIDAELARHSPPTADATERPRPNVVEARDVELHKSKKLRAVAAPSAGAESVDLLPQSIGERPMQTPVDQPALDPKYAMAERRDAPVAGDMAGGATALSRRPSRESARMRQRRRFAAKRGTSKLFNSCSDMRSLRATPPG